MLAEKSGAMIIPVAHNAGYFWPRNSIAKKSGVIQMVIGPAIDPHGKTAAEIMAEVEEWIESTVNELPKP
jgi:1-acyl-sn-glycerol-3-phosphate acyltransferase